VVSPLTTAGDALAADRDHVLARTERVWAELRGARVLVTGGTGFVGCWLLESLRWANQCLDARVDAVVLTRDPDGFSLRRPHLATAPGVRLQAGDVRKFEVAGEAFSHVVHGAASADAALYTREPLAMLETIVEGTRRTLECAALLGGATVLLISSGAVYGRQPPDLANVPEEFGGAPDPLDVTQVYAEGKRSAELIGALYARQAGLQVKVARLFAFVGPYLPLDRHFAVGNFIRDRLSGGPVAIAGDGTPFRSYLYGADLAVWLWTILLRGASCRPYNVGSARALSIAEVAQTVAEALPPAVAVTRAQVPRSGVPAERYVPDTSRAHSELGLEEWISFEEGVRRTLEWAGRR
jgi:nucleoside-diphosphate-sugar epimerase